MPRIAPAKVEDLSPEMQKVFEISIENMGFSANDVLTMARKPELLNALLALYNAVYGPTSQVDHALKQMMAELVSHAAGCMYCFAHTAHGSARAGIPQEKMDALWEYERSDLFTDAERAALNFAQAAGRSPAETTDADFDRLKSHFSEDQILEMMSLIGLFGFLNRWNDNLGTELEGEPRAFAETHLSDKGWNIAKHD